MNGPLDAFFPSLTLDLMAIAEGNDVESLAESVMVSFAPGVACSLHADIVLGVGPVDTDPGREWLLRYR